MFFIENGINLFYTDTDSFHIDQTLDPKFVNNDLGSFKLENEFDEAVYISSKVYGGKNSEFELIKIKGSKNLITFDELKKLLIKDSKILIPQEKWYKSISYAEIVVKQEDYNLSIKTNKRKLIYNDDGIFIDTKPLIIKDKTI